MANSVEQAFLLPRDMVELHNLKKHEMFLFLKRDLALVRVHTILLLALSFFFFFFFFFCYIYIYILFFVLRPPFLCTHNFLGHSSYTCHRGIGQPRSL